MSVLEVHGLRIEFDRHGGDIVDEISFGIAEGQVLALVGESGSGKSTVGLAVLGHTRRGARIAEGRVRVDGRELLSLPEAELRALRGGTVAYVPQDPASALNPAVRVGAQIEETLRALGQTRRDERMRQLLAEVLLPLDPAFLRRYPHQLSGGQQQRVVLAMAFACRPHVVVLDEPTTGLDVTTQAQVLGTVRRLCKVHGVAVLYVSHDLAVVAALAGRVAVMYAGRIVELGPERALLHAPAHPYTRGLIEAIPEIAGPHALEGIAGTAPPPGDRTRGCSFAPRCSFAVERCLTASPPLDRVDTSREVRCYRYRDVLAAGARERRPARERPVPEAETLLRVRGLNATYGGRPVLAGVDLTVDPRQCVALVGESGSGKTTLARCLAGLHHGFTGELELHGRPLAARARERDRDTRRELQYVFQNPYSSLNPRKTVAQILGQPLRLFFDLDHGGTQERIAATLERVRLSSSIVSRYPRELSGGERQRVAIARALAAEPALLVCDEVTSALDVSVQAAIVELIAELQRETQLALLFITHNLALIRTIADEVAVINAGQIVEVGKTDDIFGAPRDPYTRSLLEDTPSVHVPPSGPRA